MGYEKIKGFPYIKDVNDSKILSNRDKLPNIFIIALESFNPNYIQKRSNEGKEIMPFFDSLLTNGIYLKHFYGNSVLTDKGHLSILFSILPSFRNTVFDDFQFDNFQSLAQILSELKYKTIFYQGGNTNALKFGNEGPFLLHNGFQI